MNTNFSHLHLHTEYSMLDGLCKIPQLIEKVKKLKQTSVAITDHGNMHGVIPFYNECLKQDVKPIIGTEFYVAKKSRFDKQFRMGADQFHLTVLAKNTKGYKNLLKLTSIANLEGFSYKPRIDEEILFKYQEGLIILSGCASSLFSRLALDGKDNQLEEKLKKYKEVFQKDFFIELQKHEFPKIDELNTILIDKARKFEIPIVATNDVHYIEKEQALAQDALICVQTRKLMSETKRMSMMDSQTFYLRSTQEMIELFSGYQEAITNTQEIASRCHLEIERGHLHFPKFPLPKNETEVSYFKKLVDQGLKKKFSKISTEISKRAQYEMDIIINKGYAAYFLITQDFVNYAKDNGIGVGPGRGSAAGSLVSYALNITTLNPLEHDLPFERFLNPERPTPPDIDMDFADNKRDRVLEYVSNKYGHDKVAQVITFGRMEARVAVRDIGRVLGYTYQEVDKLAKTIPNEPGKKGHLKNYIESVTELKQYYQQPKYKKLIDIALQVEGVIRHHSVHAAAVVIADKPLTDYTAIQKDTKTDNTITQLDMYSLDCNVDDNAIGLLKFDFLGLRNLSIIDQALDLIKKYKNKTIDIENIPIDDKKTFELLSRGDTMGVFQMESGGMKRVARNVHPDQFSDIVALLALYRPGPMDLIPQFIENKKNPEKIKYPHPDLKEILAPTYGIMVYQEQILQIANKMAGYSLGEADMLRRAIGKKKKKILDQNKKRFIDQSADKGYPRQTAQQIWQFIEAFANYGFNKAHAASYAMITYETAYLKANYQVEYMAALMTFEAASLSQNKEEKIALAVENSKRMKIKILPPDINNSGQDFTIEKHKGSLNNLAIRFSLTAIKNVGSKAIENIINVRNDLGEFTSFTHFLKNTDKRKVNKKTLESLIKVGCFDKFSNRATLLENLEKIRNEAVGGEETDINNQSLFDQFSHEADTIVDTFEQIDEYPEKELLSFEKELLGFYLTRHPLAEELEMVMKRANKKIADLDKNLHVDQEFIFGGIISSLKELTTKKGKKMAIGRLEDSSGEIDFVIFPRSYKDYEKILKLDNVVIVKATVQAEDQNLKLIIEKAMAPDIIKTKPDENFKEIRISNQVKPETLKKIGKTLKQNPGVTQIAIVIVDDNNIPVREKIVLPYRVNWTENLEKKVKKLSDVNY